MARGRFLSDTVAKDTKLNSLSVEAELVYLMTIPHLDRDGLIEGDPDVLWGTVCPKRRIFIDRMNEFIDEWIAAGLVLRYDSEDGPVLWFKGFAKNQTGMRYDREAPSKFTPPPSGQTPEQLRTNSGNCRAEVEVKVEVKDQVEVEVADEAAAAVWKAYSENIPGTLTPVIVETVNDWLKEYSPAEIVHAIGIAVQRNQRNCKYIHGILKRGAFKARPSPMGGDYRPLSEVEKSALVTRAATARSKIATAQKFGGTIDPQWQKDIDAAKGIPVS